MKKQSFTISEAVEAFLDMIRYSRAKRTHTTYRTGMNQFLDFLNGADFNPDKDPITTLSEQTAGQFVQSLLDRRFAESTANIYLASLKSFYDYLILECELDLNLEQVRRIIRQRMPRIKRRLPQFSWEDIEAVLEFCLQPNFPPPKDQRENLRNLRDCAFILTLADTGLRVHEACNLKRGDIDWNRRTALIRGKGSKDALIRFSKRSTASINRYLKERAPLDGLAGSFTSKPVFARHDKRAGNRILPISTVSGEAIVQRITKLSIPDYQQKAPVTPHSFRHYFVTRVVKTTQNIKVAQELARHENIATTEIYTHLVDQDLDAWYQEVMDET